MDDHQVFLSSLQIAQEDTQYRVLRAKEYTISVSFLVMHMGVGMVKRRDIVINFQQVGHTNPGTEPQEDVYYQMGNVKNRTSRLAYNFISLF